MWLEQSEGREAGVGGRGAGDTVRVGFLGGSGRDVCSPGP